VGGLRFQVLRAVIMTMTATGIWCVVWYKDIVVLDMRTSFHRQILLTRRSTTRLHGAISRRLSSSTPLPFRVQIVRNAPKILLDVYISYVVISYYSFAVYEFGSGLFRLYSHLMNVFVFSLSLSSLTLNACHFPV
jgi:hypothetical protein